ncbi:33 kDa chaperonin [Blastomonas marina]|uniref:33 kDa chaperonin n=1 Tax=Blastomonas marina TaxID=1867408 RepID=A0ABQ1FHY8_9SPHN|nr:Hsp33 family molecular chaperone HslO [Blastomonas marina]GGA11204.1 33 kDa chaperonin [Blastomonas marina]
MSEIPENMLIENGETGFDRVLTFTIPERHARGRMVRLGPVLDTVLSAHAYPAPITHLLAEALTLVALMGSLLKGESDQLTMQAQTKDGAVALLVCDYRGGEVRGYVDHDPAAVAALGSNPSLAALFGEGFLAITFEVGKQRQRYQGIVPLEGDSLAEACESYFRQSEQLPTLIRVATRSGDQGCVAGGFLVQHLPEGEEGRERLHVRLDHPEWEHVAVMAGSLTHAELLDPQISQEALLWRLFHEEDEVRVEKGPALARGCRCTIEHYRTVLSRFPEDERAEMVGDDGAIGVDCAFCSKRFAIDPAEFG